MTEKLARRGLHVSSGLRSDVLTQTKVADTMDRELAYCKRRHKDLEGVGGAHCANDPAVARHEALLILDDGGKLSGIITRGDLLRALDSDPLGAMDVLEAGTSKLIVHASRRTRLRSCG